MQLVIFRAIDGSWTSGKPLKLSNFSGAIGSLDLQGNSIYISGLSSSNGITFTFTPIVSAPAGGGSVTGPPNTNPLDNHFQNLLTDPLYNFEEYLYDHNIDEGIFDYLDNTGKTVLSNVHSLIDPINDYLTAQNSSAARALVQAHLSALANKPAYFTRNQVAGFPLVLSHRILLTAILTNFGCTAHRVHPFD